MTTPQEEHAKKVHEAEEAILNRIYKDWKLHRDNVQTSRTRLQMELDKEQRISVSVSNEAITRLIHNGYLKLTTATNVGLDHQGVTYCERREREAREDNGYGQR